MAPFLIIVLLGGVGIAAILVRDNTPTEMHGIYALGIIVGSLVIGSIIVGVEVFLNCRKERQNDNPGRP